ncbi:hypothetical protein ORV05_23100 [Amycolatopsis cynarae]|uniref:Uncharacterized protein n=1 Tax=Amycolatopsis cynarae TaxID=2995223 RepID=A0ABY7AVY3_9PSEU|nr:hypothetical protein [Amycolatopsis sp. HUAS 11-8]WAL63869.1 hypothetical protein ORV05_23100 [Amycolatopsis sp. HUAS 11-8]
MATDSGSPGGIGPSITLPVVGVVHVPPPDRLAYFAGLGLLAAFGVVEWPVAAVIGAGHLLSDQHWSRAMAGIGEALEEV